MQTPEDVRNVERGRCRVRQAREFAALARVSACRIPFPMSLKGSENPMRGPEVVFC